MPLDLRIVPETELRLLAWKTSYAFEPCPKMPRCQIKGLREGPVEADQIKTLLNECATAKFFTISEIILGKIAHDI